MAYKQETIKPYNADEAKGEQVERMFDSIAHSYDLLNHALSLGIDKHWRRAAIRSLLPFAPRRILDVATGTGDFAISAARMLQPESLLGIDLSEGMLSVGRRKIAEARLEQVIRFEKDDCMHLSLPDDAFDAVTVAYGVRNFEDLERGLGEMLRVLRPGGRLVIIELTSPVRFPMKQLFWLYSHVLMPTLGKIISRDSRAYTYLPATMEAFPQGEEMQRILQRVGYEDVAFRRFTFGLSTLYTAQKPLPKEKETYALVGHPLGHSFSAGYFNEKFAAEGRDAHYRNLDIADIATLRAHLTHYPALRGFNVTIPHKESVMPLLDSLSDEARLVGAVNVVSVARDADGSLRLHGSNTDVVGFVESLRPLLKPCHCRALLLGTGGASKAVVAGLKQLGVEPSLVSRTAKPGCLTYEQLTAEVMAEHQIVVNCSPVGMYPHTDECPDIPYALLTPQHLLYDLVYNPEETRFLQRGKAQGATVKGGLEMLHLQAEAAWRIWNEKQ